MYEPIYDIPSDAVIKVVGVGGGGGNALNHMVDVGNENSETKEIKGVEFYSVNTDAQALRSSSVRQTVQIGAQTTKGLGSGGDPNVAHKAAEEDREALTNMLAGADMVFISTGMGGGTGTGASPVIADIAKNEISKDKGGALTVAIVTKPFKFEGARRTLIAEQGINELSKHVDSLIIIPNDKLLKVLPRNTKMRDAFTAANDVLRNAVLGITDMITSPGIINLDFADVRNVMMGMGRAMMGTGIAEGEDRAERAAQDAVASPLLEDVDLSGAKGILVSICSGEDIEMMEVDTIMSHIQQYAAPNALVKFGTTVYSEMEGKIRVTLVATGIGEDAEQEPTQNKVPAQPVSAPITPQVQQSVPPQQPQSASFSSPTSTYGNVPPVQATPHSPYSGNTGHVGHTQTGQQPTSVTNRPDLYVPSFIKRP